MFVAVLQAGCGSDSVTVEGHDVAGGDQRRCRALLDDLPDEVSDLRRRQVEGDRYAAAWGDPAIVLRCGVPVPEDFDRFSSCQRVNDVDWYVPEATIDDQGRDVVMTTIGRTPGVEVRLPGEHRPPAAAMVDLAGPVKEHARRVTGCVDP